MRSLPAARDPTAWRALDVDDQFAFFAVFADDHPSRNPVVVGLNKELTALLQAVNRKRDGLAVGHADKVAVETLDFPFIGGVVIKQECETIASRPGSRSRLYALRKRSAAGRDGSTN